MVNLIVGYVGLALSAAFMGISIYGGQKDADPGSIHEAAKTSALWFIGAALFLFFR